MCTALDGRTLAEKMRLVIFVESAIGILNLESVCRRGLELSKSGPYKLDGVVFGSDDFCADIGWLFRTKQLYSKVVSHVSKTFQ